MTVALLRAVQDYAKKMGGNIVEGYPMDDGAVNMPDAIVNTGLDKPFQTTALVEVARSSPTRPINRIYFDNHESKP